MWPKLPTIMGFPHGALGGRGASPAAGAFDVLVFLVTGEDVYQETLHRLAMRWSRVDNPRAFCRRVMYNIVIDQARGANAGPASCSPGMIAVTPGSATR